MSTINTTGNYMFSYGDVPILIDNITNTEQYNADLGVIYDKLSALTISISSQSFAGGVNVPTKIEFGTGHKFIKNSTVWVEGDINGYFKVLSTGSNYIIINFQWSDSTPTSCDVYNISLLRGSLAEGTDNITFNLKNELSNFVYPNINETNQLYPAPSTRFEYDLVLNESFKYELDFTNIVNEGGNMAIVNSGITSLTGVEYKVGDKISIEQNQTLKIFPQYDSDGTNLRFRGQNNATILQFQPGQTVNVVGGDFPGIYNVIEVSASDLTPSARELVTVNRAYTGSTVGVQSTLVGNIRPEYDGPTVIKDIFIDGTNGLTIVTEKQFTINNIQIEGKSTYAGGRNLIIWNSAKEQNNTVVWGNLTNFRWEQDNANEYVIDQARNYSGNSISTILPQYTTELISEMDKLVVNREDYLFGLVHSLDNTSKENFVEVLTYDKNYNKIGEILMNNSDELTDYYFPMGLKQIRDILNEPYVGENFGDLIADYDIIRYYEIRLWKDVSFLTRKIGFRISDCSNFDKISINFVDDKGSLLSVPTNLVNREFSEVQQDEYYKNTGKFSSGDWGYGDFRAKTIFNNREIEKIRLTTDWLKDFDAKIVKEMLTSSHKYLTIDGKLIPIQSLNDELEIKTVTNDQIINYTFEVTIALDNFRK